MAFAEGQLGKMTIIFFQDPKDPGIGGTVFTPMYNPSTLTVNHSVQYDSEQKPLSGNLDQKFVRISPRTLSTELFFDGTGASPSNLKSQLGQAVSVSGQEIPTIPDIDQLEIPNLTNRVDLQVQTFLRFAYRIDGNKHKPHYMMILWGSFVMTGVLKSANVTYTMFESDGRPLRAKINISVDEFIDRELFRRILKLNSPDVSKSVTVKQGDTLPLLCQKEYGIPGLYIKVAEANNLTNFRQLSPGQEILFPPVENLN